MAEPITTHDDRAAIARRVVRRFRAHLHHLDLQEAEQVAYLAMLTAERDGGYDPRRGSHWLYVVARRELGAWIFSQSKIISATTAVLRDAKLKNPKGYAERFRQLVYVGDPDTSLAVHDTFDAIGSHLWIEAVKKRIRQLIADPEIIDLLLGMRKPADVAREQGTRVAEVHSAMRSARRRLSKDRKLRDLWQAA